MGEWLSTILELLGAACIVAGATLLAGVGWGLLTGGAVLLGLGLLLGDGS